VRGRILYQVRRLLAYQEQQLAIKARAEAIRKASRLGEAMDPDAMDRHDRDRRAQRRREAKRQAKKDHRIPKVRKLLEGKPSRPTLKRWSVDYLGRPVTSVRLHREIMRIHRKIQSAFRDLIARDPRLKGRLGIAPPSTSHVR